MTEQRARTDIESAVAEVRKHIAENWGWFMGLGIVLLLAGVAAIAFPLLSTIAAKIALGWIFLVGGVVLVVHAFSAKQWRGFLLGLLIYPSVRAAVLQPAIDILMNADIYTSKIMDM
jgi:uncharacterized membrane protein HdeD (DUF308 family)